MNDVVIFSAATAPISPVQGGPECLIASHVGVRALTGAVAKESVGPEENPT